MACQHSCTSLLPRIWVIETLACSSQVDVSLLLDLLEKIPEIPQDLTRDAREVISLRILECLFFQRTRTDSVPSARSQKIRLDPSEHCEDVLRRILSETSASNPKLAAPEMWKWDLQPFMERKRSRLAKHALGRLKDAIVTGSNSLPSSLKEQSGLPVGKKPEHGVPVDNGTAPRLEGSNIDGSYPVQRDSTDESLLPISRKRRATTEDLGEQSWICKDISKNGKTHTKFIKKYRHEITGGEKDAGGIVAPPGVDTQIADASKISVQHNDGERCSVIEKANVGGMRLKGPAGDDNNDCTSVKGLVGLDEISLHEKQVPADTELSHKLEDELKQDDQIEEAKGDQEGVSELKTFTEDVGQPEPSNQINKPCIGEVEEEDDISSDSDRNDHDRTGVATKINASFSFQHEDTPDSSAATDWRDLSELADAPKKVVERCSVIEKANVGGMGLKGPAGDDNNDCTSVKGLVGLDEISLHEKQVPADTELSHKLEDELKQDDQIEEAKGDQEGVSELKTFTEDVGQPEPSNQINKPCIGEVEEKDDISSDSDRNDHDRTGVATKINASFSFQHEDTTDSSEATDWRDLSELADAPKKVVEWCRAHAGDTGQSESPGKGNGNCTPPREPINHDEVLPHEKKALHHETKVPNNKLDEERGQDHNYENVVGDKKGLLIATHHVDKSEQYIHRYVSSACEGADVDISCDNDGYHDERTYTDAKKKTTHHNTDKSEQNTLANVPSACEGTDVDISNDSDGCHDVRTYTDAKMKIFLSSQSMYSQDSLDITDWRKLNLCVKCHKGGKILICNSRSCPIVIHESCLGSETSFDITEKFYCPFCAYSRAISKFTELKKKSALAKKDLETFIRLGTGEELEEKTCTSASVDQNKLKRDDSLPKSNGSNSRDFNKEASNCQPRKRSEYEQVVPSGLDSRYSPPGGGKAIDSTNGVPHTSNKDKQEGKRTRQVSQSQRTCGQHTMTAQAAQAEKTPEQVPDTSDRRKHAEIRSKKGVLCPPETDLPCESEGARGTKAAEKEDLSGEEENSSGSKEFVKIQKQERHRSYPANRQLRRIRIRWTSAEEEKLKEGLKLLCKPEDNVIPWTQILKFGAGTFHTKRSAIDLKDKWRNIRKATTPKP